MSEPFRLDPRLAASTVLVRTLAGFDERLVDDRRWPWLMIVPRVPGLRDLRDLSEPQLRIAMKLARNATRALCRMHPGTHGNVAALGNVVEQFHLHVVARKEGDPNWPGPVWGHGEPVPYEDPQAWIARYLAAHDEVVPELDRL